MCLNYEMHGVLVCVPLDLYSVLPFDAFSLHDGPPTNNSQHGYTCCSSTCSSASSGVSVELRSHPMGLVGSKA